jgi:hypothetical protein
MTSTSLKPPQNQQNKENEQAAAEKKMTITQNSTNSKDNFISLERNLYEEDRFKIFLPSSEAIQKKLSHWKMRERVCFLRISSFMFFVFGRLFQLWILYCCTITFNTFL